tara:strand:- start:214 stop:537 length:324 start_codon:yes stop_codon:yes gene_type:complete
MPTPFHCHECDKTTMNNNGICDDCDTAYIEGNNQILATVTSLERRIRWLEDGLVEIRTEASELADGYQKIKGLINGILDGESTTADEFNEAQIQEGKELLSEIQKED